MKAPILEQTWFAVYRKKPARIVAIFEAEEDAESYHCNPNVYTVIPRKVRLMPGPITIASPSPLYSDLAFQYCARMADPAFPDSETGDFFDELKSFVEKYEEAALPA